MTSRLERLAERRRCFSGKKGEEKGGGGPIHRGDSENGVVSTIPPYQIVRKNQVQ